MLGKIVNALFSQDKSCTYELVINPQNPEDQCYCVKILKGEYRGTVVKYGRVKFRPQDPVTKEVVLDFNYQVIQSGSAVNTTALTGDNLRKFTTALGDIILEIVRRDLEDRSEGTEIEPVKEVE